MRDIQTSVVEKSKSKQRSVEKMGKVKGNDRKMRETIHTEPAAHPQQNASISHGQMTEVKQPGSQRNRRGTAEEGEACLFVFARYLHRLIIMLIYSTKIWLADGLALAGAVIWKESYVHSHS